MPIFRKVERNRGSIRGIRNRDMKRVVQKWINQATTICPLE